MDTSLERASTSNRIIRVIKQNFNKILKIHHETNGTMGCKNL